MLLSLGRLSRYVTVFGEVVMLRYLPWGVSHTMLPSLGRLSRYIKSITIRFIFDLLLINFTIDTE